LMRRTTRRVTPTEEGRLFYDRAMIILREAEAAYGEISRGGVEPAGMLRLTAPLDYGTKIVAPVIAAYLKTYPHMRVEAIFDDAVSNLVDEQIDLGIRVGWLA
ncbi:LysR family transcriptional regulator, partial [Mesorhizobium sp. M2D.F.Ca.ET.145.01.1.1]